MWSRKRLDIGWLDLLFGVCRVALPPDRATVTARVERLWPAAEQTLACLSVRSGFDLLLGALNLPRGSEVLVSAITIPDMIRIIERHGLAPVPVDLDPQQMTPSIQQWRQSLGPAARLILVAHLFGGRTKMEPLLDLARQHNLLVVEDCAQAFAGTRYQGHPQADVSMFSFGTIKSSTALGGAILRVRDRELLVRMRSTQSTYPVQRQRPYLKRLTKYAAMKALASRPVCGLFVRACRAIGCNYDKWVNHAARGFPGTELFAQIRTQPSPALLTVLEHRLRLYDGPRWNQHAAKGISLVTSLQKTVSCPGATVVPHTFWVFPILVTEPDQLIEHLRRAGFDATRGHSLCVVSSNSDGRCRDAPIAEALLAKMVFLPFYPEMPHCEAQRMATTVLESTGLK